jgi:hypothetical protein
VLRAVVERAVLPVFHTRQDLPLGRPVAFQLIRDDDPWHVLAAFEELAEARLGGRLMTAPLHEEIQPTVVLIHRPPHIMASPLNRGKHLIEMPCVSWSRTPAPELIGILLPKRAAPLADGFVDELIRSWNAGLGGARKGRGGEYLQKVQGTYASLA